MNALDRYAEFREQLRTLIGGRRRLPQVPLPEAAGLVKEKGRKSNYQEFNLLRHRWEERRRDLNLDEYSSFIEVSLRAAACPMPLNADVWDGLRCPFRCAYCVPSGSQIMMADGSYKVAERIRVGDMVMSYNVETNEPEVAEIQEVMNRAAPEIIRIQTPNTEARLSPEHPVFTKRGWVRADELTLEDKVMTW